MITFCRKCYCSKTIEVLVPLYPCKHAPVTAIMTVCFNCKGKVFVNLPIQTN